MAYQWVADIDRLEPEYITFRPGTTYRVQPDLSADSKGKTYDYPIRRLVIGTIKGADFGKGPTWMVLQGIGGELLVAHEQDITKREPIAPTSGYTAADLKEAGLIERRAMADRAEAQTQAWIATRPPIKP